MNPFQAHTDNMAAYEAMLSEPIAGKTGNTIACALYKAGVAVASAVYPATVGQFVVRQVLVAGGFSPRLVGQAIVRKSVLPEGAYFKTGQKLTVVQVDGTVRRCQVDEIEDPATEWRLNLWAENQAA
jgi:hypothetical protein